MNIKRFLLLVAIVAVIFLLYKLPSKDVPVETGSKLIDEEIIPYSEEELALIDNENKVDDNLTSFGDLLEINFVLKIKDDGSVVDTNDVVLAEQSNLTNYVKGPFKFILGNSGKLKNKSFDFALEGWNVGEKKIVDISPTEDEMFIKFNKTKVKSLYFNIPRYQGLPLKTFELLFGTEAKVGDVVSNPSFPWSFKIINITENNAVGDPFIKEGEKYDLPDISWPVEVDYISQHAIQLKHSPDTNERYQTEFGMADIFVEGSKYKVVYDPKIGDIVDYDISMGPTSIPAKFEILEVSDDEFIIHRIDNLNDKWLVLEAEILSRIPNVKEVKRESILQKAATEKVVQK